MTNKTRKGRVLVVEDEEDIRNLIVMHLGREGHEVQSCMNGRDALNLLKKEKFDLAVLDWMLPEMSGVEVIRELRKISDHDAIAILMVTAKATNADLILGLEAGADDYLVKPFELSVLTARARALLRRMEKKETSLELGPLVIDEAAHEARLSGQLISLTNKGRVLTRDQLIAEVQGDVAVVERAIDTHVFGLRKKLGECGDLIETVRGVGYRISSRN
jgi:two-component system phosphate regulon response regulator PhoB